MAPVGRLNECAGSEDTIMGGRRGGGRRWESAEERRLREMIEVGENDRVEFKRRFTTFEKIATEMIALANTRGGTLLIGVDDDGRVLGVDSEKHEIELVATSAEFYADPPIEFDSETVEIEGLDVVVISLPESSTKPHYLVERNESSDRSGRPRETRRKGEPASIDAASAPRRAYIRQGEKSIAASREVERVLAASRPDAPPVRMHIGKIERALFDYLETHPRITLATYRRLVNISERRASRILVRMVTAGLLRIFTEEKEDYYTLG